MANSPAATSPTNRYKVVSVEPLPAFEDRFKQSIFAGGDAAYSISLGNKKSLWLFGDSFFGKTKETPRKLCVMPRNAIALDKDALKFYERQPAYFIAKDKKHFYWPGDGLMVKNKLVLFMHETKNAPTEPPPFQFKAVSDHCLIVKNPQAEPGAWQIKDVSLKNKAGQIQIGIACLLDGSYVYIYCADTATGARSDLDKNPTALARLSVSAAAVGAFDKMEWLSAGQWRSKSARRDTLWSDGTSEMSVIKISGLEGFFAFYLPFASKAILMRHADHPEGPWSVAKPVYDLPVDDRAGSDPAGDDIFYYSVKAHPEYRAKLKNGEIILTYCTNTGSFDRLLEDRRLYFPRAVKIRLQLIE